MDFEAKKEWMLGVANRDGFFAGFLYDRKAHVAHMPWASLLGVQLEVEAEFEAVRKEGWLLAKEMSKSIE